MGKTSRFTLLAAGLWLVVVAAAASAAPGDTAPGESVLLLTAPPRETREEGEARFGPLAQYLSTVLGKRVVYEHPTTWGAYQAFMLKGRHDLVFDAPHFTGWRVEKLGYNLLLKVPGEYVYTVFVRKDEASVTALAQLRGRKVCGHLPPHLGTLLLLSEFDNPSRQPVLVDTHGYDHVFERVLARECVAGVLSTANLAKFDRDGTKTRVIHTYRALPRYALSASPRIPAEVRAKIVAALRKPEAAAVMAALEQPYGIKNLVPAGNEEYADLGRYLRNEWGYY